MGRTGTTTVGLLALATLACGGPCGERHEVLVQGELTVDGRPVEPLDRCWGVPQQDGTVRWIVRMPMPGRLDAVGFVEDAGPLHVAEAREHKGEGGRGRSVTQDMARVAGEACVRVVRDGSGPDLSGTLSFDCEGDLLGWQTPYRAIRLQGEIRVSGCKRL